MVMHFILSRFPNPICMLLCIFSLYWFHVAALDRYDINVRAEIDAYSAVENIPLKGILSVMHPVGEAIDESSAKLDKKPLKLNLVKKVPMTAEPPVELAIYQFELPPKAKGLYELPQISIKVGKSFYSSFAASYQVVGLSSPDAASTPSQSSQKPTTSTITPSATSKQSGTQLILKGLVEGPQPSFPKQRLKLIYRFYFNGAIDLQKEVLPFLDAKGFRKIGDKKVRDFTEDHFAVQEFTQEVEAIKPGTYTFPSASIEGYAYQESSGRKVYYDGVLRSEVDPVTITVAPFPEEGKPDVFSGAVGTFTFTTSLLTPNTVNLGEKLVLAILVSGQDLMTVTVPDLTPLQNSFELSNLPVLGESQKDTKRFKVELSPLSPAVKEIPPLLFSYYDPTNKRYVTLQSKPIPLKIQNSTAIEKEERKPEALPLPTPTVPVPFETEVAPIPLQDVKPPEGIPANPPLAQNFSLEESDLHNRPFGSWWIIWLIPIGLLLVMGQIYLKRHVDKQKNMPIKISSEDLMQRLDKTPFDSSEFYQLISRMLILRLAEKKLIPSDNIAVEKLPKNGIVGKVGTFLKEIEAQRFGGGEKATYTKENLLQQTKALYQEIG